MNHRLAPGDVVGVLVWVGPVPIRHVGVVSYVDGWGRVGVISNSLKLRSVREESLADFACGAEISLHPELRGRLTRQQVVARARSRIGDPYNLFASNCEHFVRWAHGLPEASPQLAVGVGVGVAAAVLALAGAAALTSE